MAKKELQQMSPLNGADMIERIRGQLESKTNACLIAILVTLLFPMIITFSIIASGSSESSIVIGFSVMFGLIAFCIWIGFLICRSREKKAEEHLIFRRYGGADNVAAIINAAGGNVIYEDKKHQFRLTPTYIMAPGDYTTFMPTSYMLLACKEDRRAAFAVALLVSPLLGAAMSSGKPSGLFLSAYNCFGDRTDYRFRNELTGGSAEIDKIVNMIQYYAPQCAVGDSPQTRNYLAVNTRMPPM